MQMRVTSRSLLGLGSVPKPVLRVSFAKRGGVPRRGHGGILRVKAKLEVSQQELMKRIVAFRDKETEKLTACTVDSEKLKELLSSVLPEKESPRVIEVACGSGWLIPHLENAGVRDILGVEGIGKYLQPLKEKFPSPGAEGNEPGVRLWSGRFLDLPDYLGPADAIFVSSMFPVLFKTREMLLKAVSLMQPLGRIVVYSPLGKASLKALQETGDGIDPRELPSVDQWKAFIEDLPLEMVEFKDEADTYLAVLQIPEHYSFPGLPVYVQGEVIPGRGIGSAKLGVPTANLKPDSFRTQLKDLPKGVYFGWVQLKGGKSTGVHKAVLNLGLCPTLKEDDHEISLEAHILHSFDQNFQGATLEVILTGYLRPEMKFSGAQELLDQINCDIGKAKKQLDHDAMKKIMHQHFSQ